MLDTTSRGFSSAQGDEKKRLKAMSISFDQELGEILGAWIRFAWQDDAAAITYGDLYSGGLNISGKLWQRSSDNVGIGYGHLTKGNTNLDHTDVFEVYGRFALNDIFALTADVQYMKDTMAEGSSPEGWIFGLRATAEF